MVADEKVFSRYTRTMRPNPIATSTSPATTTPSGTADHPKRWSKADTTRRAMKPRDVASMMSRCAGRFSAVGPPLIRRSRRAGTLLSRWSVAGDPRGGAAAAQHAAVGIEGYVGVD